MLSMRVGLLAWQMRLLFYAITLLIHTHTQRKYATIK